MSKFMHKVKDAFTGMHHSHKSSDSQSEPQSENYGSGAYDPSGTGHDAAHTGSSGAKPSADPYTSGTYGSGENTAAYEAHTGGYDSKPLGSHGSRPEYGYGAGSTTAHGEYGSAMTDSGMHTGPERFGSSDTGGMHQVEPGSYNRGSSQYEAPDTAGPFSSSATEGRTQPSFGGGGAEGGSSYNTRGAGEPTAAADDFNSGGKLDSGRLGANMMGSNMMASDNLRSAGGAQRFYR
ncbi:uncharacterized protein BP01DRAFT_208314 [Aspergillus saccharolyticus JOP 1030-1]|uniref:Uncharacterized protein n=1 Tax=Aspergillus saccharolyticus JOP 1030-1 TaxID=1450539 RepID=A0A318ZYY8_9EURO|nr:hypothetical protein BP01DRAFT_208314 [Aspergillus saccharolyticus JOP 1030-1]PYH40582.1 hypothetical protein BP01DRAFT_208314 [Aspergillus saccharolyticus JOP 1030-1]